MQAIRTLARRFGLIGIAAPAIIHRGRFKTRDVAFPFRMPAGFSGDVNRTHPFNAEPCVMDPDNPITFYGQAGVLDATSRKFRRVLDGDHDLTAIYGIAVRPYPIQQSTTSQGLGPATPPVDQPIDVLRWGYIMCAVVGAPVKGTPVYAWADAAAGSELPGKLTTTTTAGSTIGPLANSQFNGAPDADGITEVILNVAPGQVA